MRAMAKLVQRCPHARLLIVGDGEERTAIESLVSELNLGQQVQLLGTRRDIPQLLAAADIFLLTSVSEGIPLTLIEAMAAGLPCVSTSVGGTAEVVADGKTGFLVRAGDAAAFELIMRRYNQRLYRLARGILRAGAEAEDVVQESYVRAYERLGDFVGPNGFSAWLGTIVVNEALGRLRRRGRVISIDDYVTGANGGEGVRLVEIARDAVREGMALDRDPRARDIPLVTTTGDNTEWCRGAAVLAIQAHVLPAAR